MSKFIRFTKPHNQDESDNRTNEERVWVCNINYIIAIVPDEKIGGSIITLENGDKYWATETPSFLAGELIKPSRKRPRRKKQPT
jgi:hypothetical protein